MNAISKLRASRPLKVIFLTTVLAIGARTPALAAPILVENFNSVAGLGASGWLFSNNSNPIGTTGWFQGTTGVFPAQSGPANSYIAANFLNADAGGNISNWLITPSLLLGNGDTLSFYTQAPGTFADRLEVRFSSTGSSVGATDTSVGNFTTLLLTINPGLDPDGYPQSWSQFTVTLSGLGVPTAGRFAFRYFVPDTNVNANYIGIDTVVISSNASAVPEPATLALVATGVTSAFARRRRRPATRW